MWFMERLRCNEARYTLGMTQYASVNKDPVMALKILKKLRETNCRWQIRLAGKPFNFLIGEEHEKAYIAEFNTLVLELGDAVKIDGFQTNMESWYSKIGYILSLSHREGSHESLIEGMQSGALPVIRNWPMVYSFGAPQEIYPGLETFSSIEEACLQIQASIENYDLRSRQSSEYATTIIKNDNNTRRLIDLLQDMHNSA